MAQPTPSSPDPRGTDRGGLNKDDRSTNTGPQAGNDGRDARAGESQPGTQRRGTGNTQAASDAATRLSSASDTKRNSALKNANVGSTPDRTQDESTKETYLDDEAELRDEDEEDQEPMNSSDDEADTQGDGRPSGSSV
jgi:hypothetical protein